MDDRCIMPTLEAKRRGIGLHWKGKKASSISCACFGAKVQRDWITSEGKRQVSSPRFLRRKRTEIGTYSKGEKKWRNEGNEIPG